MCTENRYSKLPMGCETTIHKIIHEWAKKTPDSIAIKAPGRTPLTFSKLHAQILNTAKTLNLMGISNQDRVATILPNGPEMATSFLAISSLATYIPLNPEYTKEEFQKYLSDLEPSAILLQETATHATEIARSLGVKIIRLLPKINDDAGIFSLTGEKTHTSTKYALACTFADSTDIALILHTSGTTSQSKIVPLSHLNLINSAKNVTKTLGLNSSDSCLNIMPLFHIHGLVGALLSSIYSGSSIICTQGFDATKFYDWIKVFRPTWYTAAPTIHQAILDRSNENKKIIKNSKIRLIRSSSSALPINVLKELEKTFKAPVIESYGMTEASHQISSNPLLPSERKPGSVGLGTGTEIAIIDESWRFLPLTIEGEIVIQGPNITEGYEKDALLNSESFKEGWFRTGDLGYLDEENYLYITGRIKEIINRGGEKISPYEVDKVLLEHPNINEAVTFAIPDEKLGEDIAAAVVLKQNAKTPISIISRSVPKQHTTRMAEFEIQEYVSKRLSSFKVPSKIILLDDIPKGPTGKIQRTALAESLRLTPIRDYSQQRKYVPATTETEKTLVEIWQSVLALERIGVEDNYFYLGGDSILAAIILNKVSEKLHLPTIPIVIFLHAPTIREMSKLLDERKLSFPPASLVGIQEKGVNPPLFLVHACSGEVMEFQKIAYYLQEHPIYAFRSPNLESNKPTFLSVKEIAEQYVQELIAFKTKEPYIIGGAGIGGIIAYEMALQLLDKKQKVELLILFDTQVPNPSPRGLLTRFKYYFNQMYLYLKWKKIFEIKKGLIGLIQAQYRKIASIYDPRMQVWKLNEEAVNKYILTPYPGKTLLIVTDENIGLNENDHRNRINKWRHYVKEQLKIELIPGRHLEIFKAQNVAILAEKLKPYLPEAHTRNA